MNHTTQEAGPAAAPRGLYLKAADRRARRREPDNYHDKAVIDRDVALECARRQRQIELGVERSQALGSAFKAVRQFDATGRAADALGHLEQCLADVIEMAEGLRVDVVEAVDSYRRDSKDSPTDPVGVDVSAAGAEPVKATGLNTSGPEPMIVATEPAAVAPDGSGHVSPDSPSPADVKMALHRHPLGAVGAARVCYSTSGGGRS